jgi:hypothetical protein
LASEPSSERTRELCACERLNEEFHARGGDPSQVKSVLNDARAGWKLASAESDMLREHLQRERQAAAERLELLEQATAELTRLRATAMHEAPPGDAAHRDVGAVLADENAELRASLADVTKALEETRAGWSRAVSEAALLREHIEAERRAAVERLGALESASAELRRQIDQATQRSSLIEQLTAVVAEQHRTIEELRGMHPDR